MNVKLSRAKMEQRASTASTTTLAPALLDIPAVIVKLTSTSAKTVLVSMVVSVLMVSISTLAIAQILASQVTINPNPEPFFSFLIFKI